MLMPDGYTKGSYYLYQKEFERIQAALALPGADKAALVAQLAQAEAALVSTITLPAAKIAVTSSMVVASTVAWPNDNAGSAAVNGWCAFDGNTGTYTDTTTNPAGFLSIWEKAMPNPSAASSSIREAILYPGSTARSFKARTMERTGPIFIRLTASVRWHGIQARSRIRRPSVICASILRAGARTSPSSSSTRSRSTEP